MNSCSTSSYCIFLFTIFLKENCGGDPHSASFFIYRLVQVRGDTYSGGERESYKEESQETTESLITLLKRKRWRRSCSLNFTDQRWTIGWALSKMTAFLTFHNSQAPIRKTSIKKPCWKLLRAWLTRWCRSKSRFQAMFSLSQQFVAKGQEKKRCSISSSVVCLQRTQKRPACVL